MAGSCSIYLYNVLNSRFRLFPILRCTCMCEYLLTPTMPCIWLVALLGWAWVSPTLTVVWCWVLWCIMHMLVRQFWPPGCGGPHLFAPIHITRTVCSGRKWLPLANVLNFPCGALQMIIISHTTAAVQPSPPSIIYAAKSGIRATTTVVRFMCCNFRTHIKGADWSTAIWCKLLLCAGIAITSLHFAHASIVLEWQLHIVHAAVLNSSHLLLIATTAFAQQHIGSPHNAVHSPSISIIIIIFITGHSQNDPWPQQIELLSRPKVMPTGWGT